MFDILMLFTQVPEFAVGIFLALSAVGALSLLIPKPHREDRKGDAEHG